MKESRGGAARVIHVAGMIIDDERMQERTIKINSSHQNGRKEWIREEFEDLQRCWCLRVYVFCVCVQTYPPVMPTSGKGNLDHVTVSVEDVSCHSEFTDSTVTVTPLRSVT